jgi:hypothetical protein
MRANITSWNVLAAGDRFVAVWWQGVPGHGHEVRYAIAPPGRRVGRARTLAPAADLTPVIAVAGAPATWWRAGPHRRGETLVGVPGTALSKARTLAANAGRGFALAAAGDHAIVGWVSGRTLRVATLRG